MRVNAGVRLDLRGRRVRWLCQPYLDPEELAANRLLPGLSTMGIYTLYVEMLAGRYS